MQRWWLASGCSIASCLVGIVILTAPAVLVAQEAADSAAVNDTADAAQPAAPADAAAEPKEAAAEASPIDQIRNDFVNFLHFAAIGRFDYAQAHAQALLQNPNVSPLTPEAAETLIRLSRERPDAIDTLVILINNSTIGVEAGKVMGLIREAHRTRRMDPKQINNSIRMLQGGPTEQATGLERLVDSGEYAVPHMLMVLADAHEKELHPYVVRALPRIGKPAVNPLAAALSVNNDVVRRVAAESLGRIGYPQALAYLKRLASDAKVNQAVRQTAVDAIHQIVVSDPRVKEAPAQQLFKELAEAYYAEDDSLRPDAALDRANVWVVDDQTIKAVDVPSDIFCMVMSMKAGEASLELAKGQMDTLALWLAANFRREARLGLDVQTGEPANVDDPTRPAQFERGVSWAAKAGPACCNLVLSRGLKDMDRPVVLGAIAGLSATVSRATFRPAEGQLGLAEAIRFPDQLVRLRAAFVLARVLPAEPFAGAKEVVPVLASAFSIDGKKAYLLIDPNKEKAAAVAADLEKAGAKVVVSDKLELGLARAAEQLAQLDAIFLASDMSGPGLVQAIGVLNRDERAALAPVVVAVKEGGMLVSDEAAEADPRIGRVLVNGGALAELLAAKADQIGRKYGYQPLTAEDGVALSLESVRSLQRIAATRSEVFDAQAAEPALVQALATHPSEEVRIGTTRVLAQLTTSSAQDSLAKVATSGEYTAPLRIAAYGSLAESARLVGSRLNDALTKQVIQQAMSEPSLELRNAASQALGATINMPAELAVEAILGQSMGG